MSGPEAREAANAPSRGLSEPGVPGLGPTVAFFLTP